MIFGIMAAIILLLFGIIVLDSMEEAAGAQDDMDDTDEVDWW